VVKDPGAPVRAHRLRPLASPAPVRVETDDAGRPLAVMIEGVMRAVAAVQDRWRIDDEWWREAPVSRMYYELRLEGDRVATVYRDLARGAWWVQRY
jgi:hypothetical protein